MKSSVSDYASIAYRRSGSSLKHSANTPDTADMPRIKAMETISYLFKKAFAYKPSYFFITAIQTVIDIVQPFVGIMLMPQLIDLLIKRDKSQLRTLIILVAVNILLDAGLRLLSTILHISREKVADSYDRYFSQLLADQTMRIPYAGTEDPKTLDKMNRAKEGMDWYSGGIHGLCEPVAVIVKSSVTAALAAALIIVHAPLLMIIIAVLVAVSLLISLHINKVWLSRWKEMSMTNRRLNYLLYAVSDFYQAKDIRLYRAQDMIMKLQRKFVGDITDSMKTVCNKQRAPSAAITVLSWIQTVVINGYLAVLVLCGKLTVAVFVQISSAAFQFSQSLGSLFQSLADISRKCGYAGNYVLFMKEMEALTKKENESMNDGSSIAIPHSNTFQDIEFRNVTFTYPGTAFGEFHNATSGEGTDNEAANKPEPVLNNLSLVIHGGESLSIVGRNGQGKTTMVKLLCRLYEDYEGEILYGGVEIRKFNKTAWRKELSAVFQDFRLLSFTLGENIALSDSLPPNATSNEIVYSPEVKEKIESLCEKENLPSHLKPETMLFRQYEKTGIEPSGGEQQKIAIARALYKESPVMLLDEPTAALDPKAEYEIYKKFNELAEDRTVLYISHRLSSCRFCNNIAVIDKGRVAEYGSHHDLCKKENGIYATMWQTQAKYYQ